MKRLFSILMALVLVFGTMTTAVFAAGPTFVVSTEDANPGDEVDVTVSIENNPGLVGFGLTVTYDESKLEWTAGEANSEWGGSSVNKDITVGEYISFIDLNDSVNHYENGLVATLTFKVKEDASGKADVSLGIYDDDPGNIYGEDGEVSVSFTSGGVNIAEPPHEHISDSGTVTKEATCTETGKKEFKCTVCGEVLKTEDIMATGHDYDMSKPEILSEKTCSQIGEAKYYCKNDSSHFIIQALPDGYDETAHKWGEWTVTKEATITEEGEETRICEYNPAHKETRSIPTLVHDHEIEEVPAVGASCEKEGNILHYICNLCKKIFADIEGKTELNAEDIVEKAIGHAWDEGTVEKEATCEEPGTMKYVCENNETHTKTEEIPAKGHDWGEWTVEKEATETETGLRSRVCKNDETHTETQVIPMIGSEPEEYTITFDPSGGTINGSTAAVRMTVEDGDQITIIDAPTREGYTFVCWEGSEYQPGDKYTVTGDHTFTAKWEEAKTEEPGTDEPGTEEPGTDEPGTDEPGTVDPQPEPIPTPGGNTGDKTDDKSNSSSGSNSSSSGNAAANNNQSNAAENVPKTADENDAVMYVVLMVLALATTLVIRKRVDMNR